MLVAGRGGAVDDDQVRTREEIDQAGRRVHGKRGAGHHQQFGVLDGYDGAAERALVQRFFVQRCV